MVTCTQVTVGIGTYIKHSCVYKHALFLNVSMDARNNLAWPTHWSIYIYPHMYAHNKFMLCNGGGGSTHIQVPLLSVIICRLASRLAMTGCLSGLLHIAHIYIMYVMYIYVHIYTHSIFKGGGKKIPEESGRE